MLQGGLRLLRAGIRLVPDPTKWEPRVRRSVGVVWAAYALRGAVRGHRVTVMGPLDVENRGRLVLGARVYFLPGVLTTRLKVDAGATLDIGPSSGFAPGATLRAHERITLGYRCLVASQVVIEDAPGAPIIIEDDVWLAHGARVGPGVTIGRGSAVSAGTVVTKDVPPRHLAIGVPARNVRLDTLGRPPDTSRKHVNVGLDSLSPAR
jgi:maltose O-acetyltransferase